MLFYNPSIAFILLIATIGLFWYFDKKSVKKNNDEKPEMLTGSHEDHK